MYNLAQKLVSAAKHEAGLIYYLDQRITREQLIKASIKISSKLQEYGFEADQRILLLLHDHPTFMATFLAVLSYGGIPVPINPKMGKENLTYILEDSRAVGVVVESSEFERVEECVLSSTYISPSKIFVHGKQNGFESISFNESETKSNKPFKYYLKKGQSTSFWQYTSGTTGFPKAVQHTQDTMLKCFEYFAKGVLNLNSNDRIYSIPKMFFGYGLGNSLFFSLLSGATILLDHEWPTPTRIVKNLREFKPTAFFGGPKVYQMLLEQTQLTKEDFKDVRICFSAGTYLTEKLNKAWESRFNVSIIDGIGSTEIGHVFLTNKPGKVQYGVTGKKIKGYEVKILNNEGHTVKFGEVGNLYVKPPYISQGYWENSQVTMQKFKDGWYNTQDLFSQDEKGNFYYQGRSNDTFKVNGQWVVPSQVENLIYEEYDIVECALVNQTNLEGISSCVLFYQASDLAISQNLENTFKEYLKGKVKSYMIPQAVFRIESFPKNDNGKTIRNRLISIPQLLQTAE